MSGTRYCSTCGSLLGEGAVICGECGARYQASPYERRATTAPGAWSAAPTPRSRDLGPAESAGSAEEGIELITRDSLEPAAPGATTVRSLEQYDRMMVTQPPMPRHGPGSAPGPASGPTSPVATPGAGSTAAPMAPPLDGCVPATALKRFLAGLLDAVIEGAVAVPLIAGAALALTSDGTALLPYVLIGAGVALPIAYIVLLIWLVGAKGFSLGMLILGLRVARAGEGGRLGFARSLGRWFLFGLLPLIMALSIFLDPRKQLRGFHDRAVDSVVVDIAAGRNPLRPRPDDFERAGAEHYLGAPSVAVSTHENLLSAPGAAWTAPAPGPAASSGTWGDERSAASPFGPPDTRGHNADGGAAPSWSAAPAGAPSRPADDGWAPPPVDPLPPEPSWGRPGAAPQSSWGPSSAQPQPAWAPPSAPEAAHGAAVPGGDAPRTGHGPAGAPDDLTADAWEAEDHGVDEQTRLAVPDEPLGDLEQTRLSAMPRPPVRTLRLRTDDGTERVVEKAVVLGRNPAATGEDVLFVLKDDSRTVSKTHLRIDGTGDDVVVTDLGSTNGSAILHADGSRENLVPDSPTVLPSGAQVALGDRTVSVESEQ